MAVAVGDPVILARMPGFRAGQTAAGTDSANFTTSETEVLSLTFTEIDGVTYEIVADAGFMSSVAADVVIARLYEDSTAGTERQSDVFAVAATLANNARRTILRYFHTASATGSKTFVVTGVRSSGTGNIRLEASSARRSYLTATVSE